jgi:hypothetical protein
MNDNIKDYTKVINKLGLFIDIDRQRQVEGGTHLFNYNNETYLLSDSGGETNVELINKNVKPIPHVANKFDVTPVVLAYRIAIYLKKNYSKINWDIDENIINKAYKEYKSHKIEIINYTFKEENRREKKEEKKEENKEENKEEIKMKLAKKIPKKLAQGFRKKRDLLVEKVGEETFWVSDTHTAVKLGLDNFMEFRKKWNNYKSTEDIPKEFKVIKIVNGELSKQEDQVMENVISDNLEYKLKITNQVRAEVGELGERKLVANETGDLYMAQEFEYIITAFAGCELYTTEKFGAIHILLDGNLRALIMPVREFENE